MFTHNVNVSRTNVIPAAYDAECLLATLMPVALK